MRIISSFFDYYDGVQGMGIDMSNVYSRHTKEIKLSIPFTVSKNTWGWDNNSLIMFSKATWHQHRVPYWDAEAFLFFIAGKIYPMLKISGWKDVEFEHFVYSFEELEQYITSYGLTFSTKIYEYKSKQAENKYKFFFNFNTDVSSWMIDNNLSIALVNNKNAKDGIVEVNPRLQDYDFQRIIDPYTMYQELSMWNGGILTKTKEILDVPDKYKIDQHGFDSWSFRKYPEK